jgi:Bacterial regulatory proteins, lacI family.
MITQSKLAKLAGVSRTTVARVINNQGYVSEETRKKILELIKLTSYKPNKAGKTLAIQHKNSK